MEKASIGKARMCEITLEYCYDLHHKSSRVDLLLMCISV